MNHQQSLIPKQELFKFFWANFCSPNAAEFLITGLCFRCLAYALKMGAHITLNSYGGPNAESKALQSMLNEAEAQGQLFVTAAGKSPSYTSAAAVMTLWKSSACLEIIIMYILPGHC